MFQVNSSNQGTIRGSFRITTYAPCYLSPLDGLINDAEATKQYLIYNLCQSQITQTFIARNYSSQTITL